jgi:hypothetical protein
MFSRIARRLRAADDDRGYALLVVLGVGVMLLALIATSLTVASSGYRKAGADDDWNAALAAAYGGLEEYQSRLANDSTYATYGNPASAFSSSTGSIVTMPGTANPAFGVGASGGWAQIPGAGGAARFRYEVDNSDYAVSGTLRVRVTGKVDDQTRSIVAELRQTGFIDYIYFTDLEVFDPQLSGDPAGCATYAWATPPRDAGCETIQFGPMDVIKGPLHSNDQLLICGGVFKGDVTSSNPTGPVYKTPGGCSGGTFEAGEPSYNSTIGMPKTNSELKKETRNDLADVVRPGCLYTGPTQIEFNADGTMTVISPWTKFTNVSYTSGVQSDNPPACGTPGSGPGRLGSKQGARVPVLESNLVFVQNVPLTAGDPNYWAPVGGVPAEPAGFDCTNADTSFPGWKFHAGGYPVGGEGQPDGTSAGNPAYGCRNGDVFVEGRVNGATTVAAENFVYIVDDIEYVDEQEDILGLVGQNAVFVWNPRNGGGQIMHTSHHRNVHAAIISVAHTFTVQNYRRGPKHGTLSVFGAIAQKFRGPVATTVGGVWVSGYAKNYVYDGRLRHVAPPKFLTPVSTTYEVSQVASVGSAYAANGAKQ